MFSLSLIKRDPRYHGAPLLARGRGIHCKPSPVCRVTLQVMLFSATAAVMLCSASLSAVNAQASLDTNLNCEEVSNEINCTCPAVGERNDQRKDITLTENVNQVRMLCEKNLTYAPQGLAGCKVCPAEKWEECKTGNGGIDATELLFGTPEGVAWKDVQKVKEPNVPKVLAIPEENFPFTDQKFVVGCVNQAGHTTKCQVGVTIAARPTKKHEQTVTCAYGQASNQSHQQITITPSHNAFTLTCGDQGEVLPTLHTQTYCIIGEKTDAEAKCSGSYADVLPGYEETWWKAGNSKNSFTLTIPTDKFPKESATIMVGCGKAKTSTSERIEPESALSPSVCSVDVTIEGSGVASASSLAFTGLTAALSGTVTITALWVDSL